MITSDHIIILEIIGFVLLLLSGNRNPGQAYLALNVHKESAFNKAREKIIPDKFVFWAFGIGIGLIILGLVLQFSLFR